MVYSTCTLEPEEDEEVVSLLLEKNSNARLEPIELNINRTPAVQAWNGKVYASDIEKVLRILPQDNDTEPFFLALIRKPG